jgi:nucleotide-binding universal stress UspA family protein
MSTFPTKILLATDGSEEAQLALSTAVDVATSTNSELHVVTVMGGRAYHMEMQEIVDQLRQRGGQVLDEQVKKIEEVGGKVAQAHVRLVEEHRDRAIVDLAEELEIGLIVMGSRGLGGARRALIGSVSDSVVRHAHCPVMVVRKEKLE